MVKQYIDIPQYTTIEDISVKNFSLSATQYDSCFNSIAGIYELDKSMKYLQGKLDEAISNIADDKVVDIKF